jgi:hypothetical protein
MTKKEIFLNGEKKEQIVIIFQSSIILDVQFASLINWEEYFKHFTFEGNKMNEFVHYELYNIVMGVNG